LFLYEAVNDIDAFMKGQNELFNAVHKDAIYHSLIQEWEHDAIVAVYLNVILPALAECAKKMYADHLPGGKWYADTTYMRMKAMSVQKHNKFSESVFGYLDNLLRKNPNISVLTSEAYIVFTANKTEDWIESKSDEETRGPRGPWNAHLRVKVFKSSLFSLLYIQQATPGGCKTEVMFKKFFSKI